MGEAILLGVCLTGLQGLGFHWAGSLPKQQSKPLPLQTLLSQEPLQVVFQETEPTSVLPPTPSQEPVADLGFLNGGGGQVPMAQGSRRRRCRGVWGAVPLPEFFLILGLEIAYYGAF